MPKPFDLVRTQLENQYQDVRFDPTSGWSGEELRAELSRRRAEHPDEPRILTRAWLFHLLCTKGRVAPDPEDYFADKGFELARVQRCYLRLQLVQLDGVGLGRFSVGPPVLAGSRQ